MVITIVKYMVMKKYEIERANIAQIKEHLSAYVTMAEQGRTVLVCRRNKPVAELIPAGDTVLRNRTQLGSDPGSVVVKCDLTESAIAETDWSIIQ